MGAEGVVAHGVELWAVDVFEWDGLENRAGGCWGGGGAIEERSFTAFRMTGIGGGLGGGGSGGGVGGCRGGAVAEPVGVGFVGEEEGIGGGPAVEVVVILRGDGGGFFGGVDGELPELPGAILKIEEGDAGIVGREETLAGVAGDDVAGATGVKFPEDESAIGGGGGIGAGVDEFAAVVGEGRFGAGGGGGFAGGAADDDDFAGGIDEGVVNGGGSFGDGVEDFEFFAAGGGFFFFFGLGLDVDGGIVDLIFL